MTKSRKSLSRGTAGVALLAGLAGFAGFAVSTALPAGAAPASDPVDTAATQVATAAAQAAPAFATPPVTEPPADAAATAVAPADIITPADATNAAPPVKAAPPMNGAGSVNGAGSAIVAPGYQAVTVSVARTRGKHNQSIFQVSGGVKQAGEVLRLASSPAFRSLRPHYMPASRSGRFRYEVTVNYRNGKAKRVVTYSNTPGAPRVLLDVIRGVETMPAPVFPPGFPFN